MLLGMTVSTALTGEKIKMCRRKWEAEIGFAVYYKTSPVHHSPLAPIHCFFWVLGFLRPRLLIQNVDTDPGAVKSLTLGQSLESAARTLCGPAEVKGHPRLSQFLLWSTGLSGWHRHKVPLGWTQPLCHLVDIGFQAWWKKTPDQTKMLIHK